MTWEVGLAQVWMFITFAFVYMSVLFSSTHPRLSTFLFLIGLWQFPVLAQIGMTIVSQNTIPLDALFQSLYAVILAACFIITVWILLHGVTTMLKNNKRLL